MNRVEKEKLIVAKMIRIYCRHLHGNKSFMAKKDGLCPECDAFAYAAKRLDRCRYAGDKPVCSVCPTHCYNPAMQSKIIEVMRYAGPRMIFHHPFDAILYLVRKRTASKV